MENKEITVPVLFIGFNRPKVSLQTFDYIRKAKPTKLYIAIDGPRADKPDEEKLVTEVKKVVENVDWPCETHYKYNETNKGAEITVSSAISWVFETEEYTIILEDDIVAPLSFFKFAQEMLFRYKDEEKIWAISGVNFTPLPRAYDTDYFFAKYGHTWGWATWKRVWNNFDLYAEVQEEHLSNKFLASITNSKKELIHYKKKFKRILDNGKGNSTWDNMASYMHRTKGLLYIVPSTNLISNIGDYGLHARGKTKYHYTDFDKSFIVKKHPENIECNVEYDKYHFRNYINKKRRFMERLILRVKSMIKSLKL
ncbi:MAG: hypothetical protein RBR40_02975 [Tenuifilaceae bacterium]|nr:hypothetical protein [Tenuifilaceae bacterium]